MDSVDVPILVRQIIPADLRILTGFDFRISYSRFQIDLRARDGLCPLTEPYINSDFLVSLSVIVRSMCPKIRINLPVVYRWKL